jgi:hypothetical protein
MRFCYPACLISELISIYKIYEIAKFPSVRPCPPPPSKVPCRIESGAYKKMFPFEWRPRKHFLCFENWKLVARNTNQCSHFWIGEMPSLSLFSVQYLFVVRRKPKEMLLARENPKLRLFFFWRWGISLFYVQYELVARQKLKKVTVGG